MVVSMVDRLRNLAVPALALVALSACASSDVSGIDVATQEQIRNIRVSEVNVTMQIPKPNPRLQTALKDQLEQAMPRCATGGVDHRMDVVITDFEEADVGKAIFLGDEIELEGRVGLIEAGTGEKMGEYYVSNSFFWGGLIGAAMMADAEKSLSKDFASNVCKELFGVNLQKGGG